MNYWNDHGLIFSVCILMFPRLTLLLSSIPTGGFFWWLGWIFAPRFLVAILATLTYWESNPIVVIVAWIAALAGESSEKYAVKKRVIIRHPGQGVRINIPGRQHAKPIKDVTPHE